MEKEGVGGLESVAVEAEREDILEGGRTGMLVRVPAVEALNELREGGLELIVLVPLDSLIPAE